MAEKGSFLRFLKLLAVILQVFWLFWTPQHVVSLLCWNIF